MFAADGLLVLASFLMQLPVEGRSVAELLETAAEHEEWVSKIRSIHFRAKSKHVQSEKSIEVERARPISMGGDADVPIKSPSLLPTIESSEEVAWDGKRIAVVHKYSAGLNDSHRVWDGTQFTSFQDGVVTAYLLDNEAPAEFETPIAGSCYWPFNPRFSLRTTPTVDVGGGVEVGRASSGTPNGFQPDQFTLHTPDLFHGVLCHRLVSTEKQIALFIDVDSGCMIGKREAFLSEPLVQILTSLGHSVKDTREAEALLAGLDSKALAEIRRAASQSAGKLQTDTLLSGPTTIETWVSDFRPTPFGLFPMKHYRRFYGIESDVVYERYRTELEVLEIQFDDSLVPMLFQIELRDGVTVVDNRFETTITYAFDSQLTAADLQALVRKSKESVSKLDALIGQPLLTAFAQERKLGYPIAVDVADDSEYAFGPLPVTRMPYTILVDAAGVVVSHGDLETLLPLAETLVAND